MFKPLSIRLILLFLSVSYISMAQSNNEIKNFNRDSLVNLDDIVITGTKTPKRKIDSPVIINVINSNTINNVQACNLSESLSFQSGLRVETDCQTCNYTQLRINGMSGGFSQILINGRPTFGPLMGLYALEQFPSNMIDRIEIMKGGGSTLYGSSAIGGTVNVITKTPKKSTSEIEFSNSIIANQSNDYSLSANSSVVSKSKKSGLSLFVNKREREYYDNNNDNYSEIPHLNNISLGGNLFFIPTENKKLDINFSKIFEYRYGGEMIKNIAVHNAQQAEERTHNIFTGNIDYEIYLNDFNSSLISYFAYQRTDREHYTGILPESDSDEYTNFLVNPPYGYSNVETINTGVQFNHIFKNLNSSNILTMGFDLLYDKVFDEISSYNYLINQISRDIGVFLQSDWEINERVSLLSGVRTDFHNYVDKTIFSPRVSMLYKYDEKLQFRLGFGTGFRAPQALDTDLHIAFAGGGISRITISEELKKEKSNSYNLSLNFDEVRENWIAGFTIDLFYNILENSFILQPVGQDEFGELFEKQNGDRAVIKGFNFETRANINNQFQFESGFTIQSSNYENPVQYISEIPGIKEFIRTPKDYGYALVNYTKNNISSTLNYVYTGSMKIPHFAGSINQTVDEIKTSRSFHELSTKINQNIKVKENSFDIYCGVKNIFNAYQNDFDIGKNRDSNYIYGPSQPRTIYIGIKYKLE